MRVIKHGIYLEKEQICPKCQCVFGYQDNDIAEASSFDYGYYPDRGRKVVSVVQCPECNCAIEVLHFANP